MLKGQSASLRKESAGLVVGPVVLIVGKSAVVNGILGGLVILGVGLILQTLASLVNWTSFFNV